MILRLSVLLTGFVAAIYFPVLFLASSTNFASQEPRRIYSKRYTNVDYGYEVALPEGLEGSDHPLPTQITALKSALMTRLICGPTRAILNTRICTVKRETY